MESVVLKRFDNYFSAHILHTRLAEHGMASYVIDENTVTLTPYFSNAIGNIKVIVAEQDEQAARTLLQQFEQEALEHTLCPKCGARKFIIVPSKNARNFLTSLFTWMFSNLAISAENVYQCTACGYESSKLPEPDVNTSNE